MPAPKNCIRFLLSWRGHEPGQINRELDPSVMDALVQARRAEWCECEDEPTKPKRRKR